MTLAPLVGAFLYLRIGDEFMPVEFKKDISWADIMSMLSVAGALVYFIFFAGVDTAEFGSRIDANTARIANIDSRIEKEEQRREKGEKKLIRAIEKVEERQEVIRKEQREDNIEQNRKLDAIIRRLPHADQN